MHPHCVWVFGVEWIAMLASLAKYLALAAVLGAVSGQYQSYIYGGMTVPLVNVDPFTGFTTVKNQGEFPYLVALEVQGQHFCGGALLKADVVVTAAHCLSPYRPEHISVRAGGVLLVENSKNVQVRQLSYYLIHEQYDETNIINDIGLIKTASKFTLNNIVGVINLARSGSSYVGQTATIVGWGQTEESNLADVMKKSTVTIIPIQECAQHFHPVQKITYNMICGMDKNQQIRGICTGDSGGPTVIHNPSNPAGDVLIGVNSFVSKPQDHCDTRFPSVFSNVAMFRSWLDRELGSRF